MAKTKKQDAAPAAPIMVPPDAQKPLCDLVCGDITELIWSLQRAHVAGVEKYQRQARTPTAIVVLPPPPEATSLVSLLVQRAGIAERAAVLQVISTLVDAETQGRIVAALREHRGPVTPQFAVWSKVGQAPDGKAQAYVMSLDTDYALAK